MSRCRPPRPCPACRPTPLGRSRGRLSGARRPAARRAAAIPRALGLLGLLGIVVTVFLTERRSRRRTVAVRAGRSGGWPGWLAGPLEGLGMSIGSGGFQTLTLIMCASYLLVLALARALPMGALVAAIVAAHAILLLGPPLISQDVFGYMGFARLGALHGLDPYTHVAAQALRRRSLWFVGWPFKHSPYGPLFTLASYATAPLGLAGALWAFKALAVASSLGAIALIARAAGKLGPLAALGGRVRRPEPRAARAGRRRGAQRHADRADARRGAGADRRGQPALPRGRRCARGGHRHQGDRRAGAALPRARIAALARAPAGGGGRRDRPARARVPSG